MRVRSSLNRVPNVADIKNEQTTLGRSRSKRGKTSFRETTMLSILNGLLLRTKKTVKQARSVQRAIAPVTVQNLEPRTLMTATWLSGVGDGNWNSPGNWDNGLVPVAG